MAKRKEVTLKLQRELARIGASKNAQLSGQPDWRVEFVDHLCKSVAKATGKPASLFLREELLNIVEEEMGEDATDEQDNQS